MSDDPYVYPGTNVLRNKGGYRTREELDHFERLMTTEAMKTLPPVEVSPKGLRKVHEHLFKDVYDWAGEHRIINIRKAVGEIGSEEFRFVPAGQLDRRIDTLFDQIKNDSKLSVEAIPDFANALAPHFRELNVIHPFREGNGRTQRLMIQRIAETNGHRLTFGHITGERMIQDSIDASVRNDPAPLANLIRDAANPITRLEMTMVLNGFRNAYGEAEMEQFYVTHGRIGDRLEGTLAIDHPNGIVALIDEKSQRIVIGERADLSDPKVKLGDEVVLTPSVASIGNRVIRAVDAIPEQEARKIPPLHQAIKAMDTIRTIANDQPPTIRNSMLENAPGRIAGLINEGKDPSVIAPKVAEDLKPNAGPSNGPRAGPKAGPSV